MIWKLVGLAVIILGAIPLAIAIQGRRFERRVHEDARALFMQRGAAPGVGAHDPLPPPVLRYLELAGATRHPPVRSVRLQHGGTFRPGDEWMPIRGEQYFTANPPGFVWWGRVRIAPGLWIDARDRSVAGEGHMLVLAASTWKLGDVRGPELDQGALTRLLGEMTSAPGRPSRFALRHLDPPRRLEREGHPAGRRPRSDGDVSLRGRWARRRVSPPSAIATFEGHGVLTPFVGECSDFREIDGLKLPFQVVGSWLIDGKPHTYVRFQVERIELDRASPF